MRRRQLQPRCSRWGRRAAPSSFLARLASARARRGRLARRMVDPILRHNALRWGRRAAPIQCLALMPARGANQIPRATGQLSTARGKNRRVSIATRPPRGGESAWKQLEGFHGNSQGRARGPERAQQSPHRHRIQRNLTSPVRKPGEALGGARSAREPQIVKIDTGYK